MQPATDDRDRSHYRSVVAAIRKLPPEYQDPLLRRYIDEQPYRLIARMTGRPLPMIRQLIYEGTRLLQRELAPLLQGEL